MSRVTGLSNLLEEAQHMLSSVGEVLASTMQQGIGVIKNYEELAATKVGTNKMTIITMILNEILIRIDSVDNGIEEERARPVHCLR